MQNRQIDKNKTKQVRVSVELHQQLKLTATKAKMTIKAFLDKYLPEWLSKLNDI